MSSVQLYNRSILRLTCNMKAFLKKDSAKEHLQSNTYSEIIMPLGANVQKRQNQLTSATILNLNSFLNNKLVFPKNQFSTGNIEIIYRVIISSLSRHRYCIIASSIYQLSSKHNIPSSHCTTRRLMTKICKKILLMYGIRIVPCSLISHHRTIDV